MVESLHPRFARQILDVLDHLLPRHVIDGDVKAVQMLSDAVGEPAALFPVSQVSGQESWMAIMTVLGTESQQVPARYIRQTPSSRR